MLIVFGIVVDVVVVFSNVPLIEKHTQDGFGSAAWDISFFKFMAFKKKYTLCSTS